VKIHPKKFRIREKKKIRLEQYPTRIKPLYRSEKDYKRHLSKDAETLSELQRLLDASRSYAVLLVFQAMDAAGKDGAIGHVLTGVNPEGCEVHSFKTPSAEELDHDFLWRTACRLPGRGRIGVFNRSYYEEVLITKVHPEILLREGIPEELLEEKRVWPGRYRSIVEWEQHLHRNGTRIIKFFLHLSKEEQRKRFLARIDEAHKNWKFSPADVAERKFWKQYRRAYEDCLGATSTPEAPWHVIPADDKYNARLLISRLVIAALRQLKLAYPQDTPGRKKALRAARRQLVR
jgi:PPK2 family polyphosphate:nucleotide phosphotransferase